MAMRTVIAVQKMRKKSCRCAVVLQENDTGIHLRETLRELAPGELFGIRRHVVGHRLSFSLNLGVNVERQRWDVDMFTQMVKKTG